MTGQAATDAGPTGAGLLYDAHRGVYSTRPVLRDRLHPPCSWASLAGGVYRQSSRDGPRRHGAAHSL